MNTRKKKSYVGPIITITTVEMEVEIAVSSHTIKAGGPTNEPKIDDWDSNTNDKFKNFDL